MTMAASKLLKDPGTYVQAIIDTHYAEVANNAFAYKLTQGDVGEEALYDAIMNAYNAGDVDLVAAVLNVKLDLDRFSQPYRQQFEQVQQPPAGEDGGGFDYSQIGDWLVDASEIFTNIFGAVSGNTPPPAGNGTTPPPAPAPGGMDKTTLIILVVAILAAIIIAYMVTRK